MPRPRSTTPTYSLTQREGWWYVQWWDGAAAKRVSCRTKNQAAARRFLAEFRVGAASEPAPEAPTIGDVLDGYEAARAKKRHSPTLQYDVATLKRHLQHLPVNLMNAQQSDDYCDKRRGEPSRMASAKHRKTPRPLSDGTLIRELGVLRTALTWAVREKWIAEAPYVERPSAPAARERWLTHDEYERLLAASKAHHARLYIALATNTGARMGALLELTWKQVDLEGRLIDLGKGRGRKRRPKVPITDDLHPKLLAASQVATSDYVIDHGGEPIATVKTGIRAAARRAKIPGVTPTVFRHTAATWMVQDNVPFGMIARWLGTTVAMIEKHYGHHSPEWLKRASAAFSRPMAEKTNVVERQEVQ